MAQTSSVASSLKNGVHNRVPVGGVPGCVSGDVLMVFWRSCILVVVHTGVSFIRGQPNLVFPVVLLSSEPKKASKIHTYF